MRPTALALFLIAGIAAGRMLLPIEVDPSEAGELARRPLALPVLRAGDRCPVSPGNRREPYIFCSGCLFFGKGPVYFAWTFRVDDPRDAMFDLEGVPRERSVYRAKTAWVSSPAYSGPILIRGRRLDGKDALRFRFVVENAEKSATLRAPNADPSRWSFWPSHLFVPGPGCYGVQIDTNAGSDLVVFSAAIGR